MGCEVGRGKRRSVEKEILLIDDDESVALTVRGALQPLGYNVTCHSNLSSGLQEVKDGTQIILLGNVLPDGNNIEALKEIRTSSNASIVIMMTTPEDIENTMEAMKDGAYDYITKPFDPEELKITIGRAFKDMETREELHRLRGMVDRLEEPMIVGKSEKMRKVFKNIGRAASKDITVLITGESGSGKKLVAKAIHYHSNRLNGPFVIINSASIPRDLLEAELFGWEKGAFAGARERYMGKIQSSRGGTLFFDEISDLDMNLQGKLLIFMQDRQFRPLGSDRVMEADVRVIGATNRDLRDAVSKGIFREDLYHRLNVVQIKLHPLRERKEDILPLARHFLREAERKLGTGRKDISKDAKEFMLGYDWPGNVRELENAIKRACILPSGELIEKRDLFLEDFSSCSIKDFLEEKLKRYLKEMTNLERANLYDTVISEVEKAIITIVLEETGGNQQKAARTLGINRNTLRARIKKYGI
jgi:two-component system, NtrC family, nitrogen regulation response regulator GlnG